MNDIPDFIKIKKLKKVLTNDLLGNRNGYLVDILNRNDKIFSGRENELFQQVYYSTVMKGAFKGFHIHPTKYDTITCLQGKALLVIYPFTILQENLKERIEISKLIVLPVDDSSNLCTISFPSKYPHGYFGVSENALILNYRNPAWTPNDKYQYDYHLDGIEKILLKWANEHEDC